MANQIGEKSLKLSFRAGPSDAPPHRPRVAAGVQAARSAGTGEAGPGLDAGEHPAIIKRPHEHPSRLPLTSSAAGRRSTHHHHGFAGRRPAFTHHLSPITFHVHELLHVHVLLHVHDQR